MTNDERDDEGYVIGPSEPPRGFFEGLGRLVYEFGHLDSALSVLLSVQLQPGSGYMAGLVAQGESTDWLRNRCVSVLELDGPLSANEVRELRQLLEKSKGLITLRNRFVHSYWHYVPKFNEMHGFQGRRFSETYEFGVDVGDLAKTASRVREVTDRMHDILDPVTSPGHVRARKLASAARAMRQVATDLQPRAE